MAVLKFNSKSYTVDHAVKGDDYVHGYNANGICIVSIDGVKDFSTISYSGTYLSPDECLAESRNDLKYCGNELLTNDGRPVQLSVHVNVTLPVSAWTNSTTAGFVQSIVVGALTENKKAKVYPAWPDALGDKLTLSEETTKIRACSRYNNVLTFECWEECPTCDIPVVVEVYV